jgi:hypothetical protein
MLRVSPAGRRKPATQAIRPSPFAVGPRQKLSHGLAHSPFALGPRQKLSRGPAHLAGARSWPTHPVLIFNYFKFKMDENRRELN